MSIKSQLKKKVLQPLLYLAFFSIIISSIDLNVPHIILKIALSILLLIGIYLSWLEKNKIIREITSKYVDMSTLLENVDKYYPDFILCKDENLKITMCNSALKKYFKKLKIMDYKTKKITQFLSKENAEIIDKNDDFVLKNQKNTKFQLHDKENNKYYECISIPLKKSADVVGLATLIKDVTFEVKQHDELKESYFQIETVIKNLPMVAYIMDLDGNYIMGNPQSYKFYTEGIDPEHPNIQIDLNCVNDIHCEENKTIFKTKKSIVTERYLKTIDGSFNWYLWRKIPWFNSSGELKGVVMFIRNIDAIKNAQKQRDNYIATLSHDLKTPTLAQIRTIELFLKGAVGDLTKEQEDLMKLMLDSSHYMYSMVETLVSTYKYENGEVVLNYEHFNLLTLIEETIAEQDELIRKSQVNIKIESKVVEPYINADKLQLKRVIENLISNGVSYGYKDSVLTILINEVKENNIPKVCVKFINNSPYMTPETISNIFKRYVSHADKFNRVGAGLGLYLFKQIIDAHNGNVFVTSSKDDINTFGFVLNKN